VKAIRWAECQKLLTSTGFEVIEARYTCGYLGSVAHDIYTLTKYPVPLRLLTFPLTAFLVAIDVRRRHSDGQGLLVCANRAERDIE